MGWGRKSKTSKRGTVNMLWENKEVYGKGLHKKLLREEEMNEDYNGWSNYETWNVSLWINNDEGLYNMAKEYESYKDFRDALTEMDVEKTPDGVSFTDPKLDLDELESMFQELNEEECQCEEDDEDCECPDEEMSELNLDFDPKEVARVKKDKTFARLLQQGDDEDEEMEEGEEKEEMSEARLEIPDGLELRLEPSQDDNDVADLVFADGQDGTEKERLGIDHSMALQFMEVLKKVIRK